MKSTEKYGIAFSVLLIRVKRSVIVILQTIRNFIRGGHPKIRAAVCEKILSKVDRLFSNRLSDIFIELLQNARRAGATEVDVRLEEIPQGTRIVFADNGEGIRDFSVLLHLGDSDWDPETDEKEDPAGMGFFSLLHSGVLVRSRGQEANIRKEGFLGSEAIEVLDTRQAPKAGTQLIFVRSERAAHVRDTLKQSALYGCLGVRLDGEIVPREDFLKDALVVKEVSGVRIGVYRQHARSDWNFHGRVLGGSHNLPSLSQVFLDPDGRRSDLHVRIDVQEARYIHLKLPDRTGIVEDENYTALCREARIAMYEYLASLPEHTAYFSHLLEARELGISLKEASPWFRTLYEDPSWEGDSREFFGEKSITQAKPAHHVIVDRRDSSVEFLAFSFLAALEHLGASLSFQAVEDTPGFEGYSWYRAIPRLHSFRLSVDGKEVEEDNGLESSLTVADSIQLSFVLERDGSPETISWDIPFAGFKGGDWYEEYSLVVTRTSPWVLNQGKAAPFDLVDAAVYIAFSPSDDFEADSSETQLQNFRDDAQSVIIGSLGGTLAQLRYALDEALSDWKHNVTGLLREANIAEVRLRRQDRGQWEGSSFRRRLQMGDKTTPRSPLFPVGCAPINNLMVGEATVEDEQSETIAKLKEWLRENGERLMHAGIAVIEGRYSGSGDQGQFAGIETLNGESLPADYDLPKEIEDLIEALADQLAPPGYEDGEGGGGEVRLVVDTGSITHESYYFVVERSYQGPETY